jgi:hypothetical protein
MSRELLADAHSDDLPTIVDAMVQWLIVERGALVDRNNALAHPVLHWSMVTGSAYSRLPLPSERGEESLKGWIFGMISLWDELEDTTDQSDDLVAIMTAILRVLAMKEFTPLALPRGMATQSFPSWYEQVVQEWARLQARLPAYLAQRQALLNEHCPLIEPLRALVKSYDEPTTSEGLWATGLGDE